MAMSGAAMLLKSMGLDPEELQQSIEAFKSSMAGAVQKIDANQARIEAKLDEIIAALPAKGETHPVL